MIHERVDLLEDSSGILIGCNSQLSNLGTLCLDIKYGRSPTMKFFLMVTCYHKLSQLRSKEEFHTRYRRFFDRASNECKEYKSRLTQISSETTYKLSVPYSLHEGGCGRGENRRIDARPGKLLPRLCKVPRIE